METDRKTGSADDGETSPIVPRPHLAYWFWSRQKDWKAAGELLGVHAETARCYCLEFGNPDRRVPRSEQMRRIIEVTQGEVVEADFHRPRIYKPGDFELQRHTYEVVVEGVSSDAAPRIAGGRP